VSALERISYIDSRIREAGGVQARSVADRFETSERQIRRDIEYLRYRLNVPLRYVRERARYEYTEPYAGLSFVNEKALLFYVFSRAAASTLAYVPVTEKTGLKTILDAIPRDLRPLADKVRYELPDFEPADEETLSVLLASISEARRFDAAYKDSDGRTSERRAVGLRLLNYAGVWYCAAWDLDKIDFRIFRLSRISRISLSRDHIQSLPDERRVDEYMSLSYGVYKGAATESAVIKFYGWARSVVEHEIWHPDQERSEGTDPVRGPWIQLTLPASNFKELLGRTLRFGSMAVPISPKAFRDAWKKEIERMHEISKENT